MPPQKPKDDNPIPEDYREVIGELAHDPAYIKAWKHAAKMGNPPKACMVYADNQWQTYQEQETPEQIRAQAERLMQKADKIEAGGTS